MLQTQYENEQFNIFSNNRLRNDLIATDRPDSAQLVDLHIYLIPKSVWRNVQNCAENQVMDEAISAGFVRVSPDMKIRNLRESIERLCGKESYFPRDFIFLRSVGRCFTRVKSSQEDELKVKNYRPPQTLASEIYLLEGRHEDYGLTPSVSPALTSASYLFGNRHQHRFNFDDYAYIPTKYSHRKPSNVEKSSLPLINPNRTKSARRSLSRLTHIGSGGSSPNMSVITSVTSKDLSKLKEEQERLRQRQAELERMRRAAEAKRHQSERDEEEERRRRQQEKAQSEREEEEERRRRQQEKAQAERQEEERRRRQQEKLQSEHDEEERRHKRQEKAEAERRRLEQQEIAATKIQASYRGFRERQAHRERQRKRKSSRKSSNKSHTTIKIEKKHDINDDDLSDSSDILTRSSIGSTSDVDSISSRPETRTIRKESKDSIDSNSSSLLSSMKTQRKISSSSYTKTEDFSMKTNNIDDHENNRSATVTKIRLSDDKIFPISTPDIPNNDDDDDTHELQRRATDAKRRQQLEEEKRRAKELEDKKRRELADLRHCEDPETLRKRLHEIRMERADLENLRNEVIKRLKHMHLRITSRRKDARDMWKKKYFNEKKKTPTVEERTTQLKTELELLHDKILQIVDNESKHSAQVGCVKEAEIGNSILQIKRTEYDIQTLRYQVDQAKLRLTTDIKLRNQAETECRTLKHELGQAKMNLNHIKNRIQV